ncbi:MAG: eukaryotic-like serine/threonine-protein kinase, partial [bacterium]
VVGSSVAVAQQRLEKAGFEVSTVRSTSTKDVNEVIGQNPRGGTTADSGAHVTLTVSDGPKIGTVPDVVGQGRNAAAKALRAAGYRVTQSEEFSDDVRRNRVISQNPSARSSVRTGTTIELVVSKGPQTTAVPDVVGRTQAEATDALQAANFKVEVREKESAGEDPGTVLAQDPASGEQAPTGSAVTLTVAKQPKSVAVPDVTGKTQAEASKILSAKGFEVNTTEQAVDTPDQDGVVLDQSPSANVDADRGSEVTITVGTFDPNLNPEGTSTTTTPQTPPPPPPP